MLPRKYRLNSRTRLINASSIAAPFFLLKVASNGLSYNRYGFVVSRNIDKRAVVRNRIKRRIRSSIEHLLQNIQTGHDMLFIVKQNISDQSFEALQMSVEKTLKKGNLLV